MEAGEPAKPDVIKNMGKLIGRHIKDGTFIDGAGLHPSRTRARVSVEGGERRIERGPYTGGNELLASFAMIHASSLEHAIELATRLVEGGGEVEIGPVVERWDLFGGTRPADAPHRFLLLRKVDRAGSPVPQAVLDEWKAAGVLQSAAVLAPSKQGVRYQVVNGKRAWTDGPFTESKELIAGFSLIEMPSLEEARAFTVEYAGVLGDNSIEIRAVTTSSSPEPAAS